MLTIQLKVEGETANPLKLIDFSLKINTSPRRLNVSFHLKSEKTLSRR